MVPADPNDGPTVIPERRIFGGLTVGDLENVARDIFRIRSLDDIARTGAGLGPIYDDAAPFPAANQGPNTVPPPSPAPIGQGIDWKDPRVMAAGLVLLAVLLRGR